MENWRHRWLAQGAASLAVTLCCRDAEDRVNALVVLVAFVRQLHGLLDVSLEAIDSLDLPVCMLDHSGVLRSVNLIIEVLEKCSEVSHDLCKH